MKTKLYTFVLVAVAAIVSSCGGAMSARVYNETIVALHDKTGDELNTKMEQIFDHENTPKEAAETLITELEATYNADLKVLELMKYPEAAADWHAATTGMFSYIKDNVLPLFRETLQYEPESSEWYDVWNEIDNRLNGTASELEDKMIEAQAAFAEASGQHLQ